MALIDHDAIEDKEVFKGVFGRQLVNNKIGGAASITVGELKLKPGVTGPQSLYHTQS